MEMDAKVPLLIENIGDVLLYHRVENRFPLRAVG